MKYLKFALPIFLVVVLAMGAAIAFAQIEVVVPAITADAATFTPGGTAAITVTGFVPGESFNVAFVNAAGGSESLRRTPNSVVPVGGTYTGTIAMPRLQPYGVYTITASQGNLSVSTPITTSRLVLQSAGSFAPGSPISIRGLSWAATTLITATLDITGTTCAGDNAFADGSKTTSAQGGFGIVTVMPAVGAGTYYINVTDGTNCVTAQ